MNSLRYDKKLFRNNKGIKFDSLTKCLKMLWYLKNHYIN